jgi:DNA-binding transcriptional LysR family regulator
MELRQLECFLAVAEELHFGRAAERLFLGQPTVSEAVRRLESAIGGALFDRSSRHVQLTRLGERFLPEAQAAVLQVQRAYEIGRGLAIRSDDVLAIGYAEDIGHDLLQRCLAELRSRFPDTVLALRKLDTGAQLDALQRGILDLGIGWNPRTVRPAAVAIRRLSTERLVTLLPADHPLASRRILQPHDLSNSAVLTWTHHVNSGLCDQLITAFTQSGATLRIVGTADSVDAIGTLVAAGAGVGMAVASAVATRSFPGLRLVPLTGPSTTVDRVLLLPTQADRPAQLYLAELLSSLALADGYAFEAV